MKKNKYDKIMGYLDILEAELNKIAASVGHPSYDEFFSEKEHGKQCLKKAA